MTSLQPHYTSLRVPRACSEHTSKIYIVYLEITFYAGNQHSQSDKATLTRVCSPEGHAVADCDRNEGVTVSTARAPC